LFGCGTWSLILREEHSLTVFGNRMLRIFETRGCGRETGDYKNNN
jgi:hypothetical protein